MSETTIQLSSDGRLVVPSVVTIPFITGDGIGPEIMPVMQQVIDQAVKTAYKGKRLISWKEVPAGQRA